MSNKNIRRVNKNLVPKGTANGTEIYQDSEDNKLYYKNTNGQAVEVLGSNSDTITTIESDITTIQGDIVALQTPEWTYTEVAITAAQLNALTEDLQDAITLLPASGTGTYNDVFKMFWEYSATDGGHTSGLSGQYLTVGQVRVIADSLGGLLSSFGDTNIYETYGKGLTIGTNDGGAGDYVSTPYPIDINGPLYLRLYLPGGLVSSDGTLLIKIWYRVRTVGTEL